MTRVMTGGLLAAVVAVLVGACDDGSHRVGDDADVSVDADVGVDADIARDAEIDGPDADLDLEVGLDADEEVADADEHVDECAGEEMVCADGAALLCDGGVLVDLSSCPLGCDEASRECRVPSNIPPYVLDAVPSAPGDLLFEDVAEVLIDTSTGQIVAGEEVIREPLEGYDEATGTTFTVTYQVGGPPRIGIFDVGDLVVGEGVTVRGEGDNALVFLVSGEAVIEGTLSVAARGQLPGPGGSPGGAPDLPGAEACGGGQGAGSADDETCVSGSGGGANGGAGGSGGASTCSSGELEGGSGGAAGCSPVDLRPLSGGAGGGGGVTAPSGEPSAPGPGGGGGGALQISAALAISIGVSGVIDAGGAGGSGADHGGGAGGGSGGSVLLEAPTITVVDGGAVVANGGGGGGGDDPAPDGLVGADGEPGSIGTDVALGGDAPGETSGAGGAGGAGESFDGSDAAGAQYAGGGGGGTGRVRFNSLSPPLFEGVVSPAFDDQGSSTGSLVAAPLALPETGTQEVDGTTYWYYVPACASDSGPTPVLYTFHGSGGSGASMGSRWIDVASTFCFIVIAQDSGDPRGWGFADDGNAFVAVIGDSDSLFDIDEERRYVHGYSAGAHWIYGFGLYNSDFFAGLGVYAGSLYAAIGDGIWPDMTGGPMPIFIAHGTNDTAVPYSEALAAQAEFEAAGWPVMLWTAEGGTHAYEPAHQWEAWLFWQDHL